MYFKVRVTTANAADCEAHSGEFERRDDEHPILTALGLACGSFDGGDSARDRLWDWSSGAVDGWAEELPPDDPREEHEFEGDATYLVQVSEYPI